MRVPLKTSEGELPAHPLRTASLHRLLELGGGGEVANCDRVVAVG